MSKMWSIPIQYCRAVVDKLVSKLRRCTNHISIFAPTDPKVSLYPLSLLTTHGVRLVISRWNNNNYSGRVGSTCHLSILTKEKQSCHTMPEKNAFQPPTDPPTYLYSTLIPTIVPLYICVHTYIVIVDEHQTLNITR